MLMARKIDLEESADNRGFLRWACQCGQTFKGNVEDPAFLNFIFIHVEECPTALRSIAFYPEETKDKNGFCVECEGHAGNNGGRCKNIFVDNEGKRTGRCECHSKKHPKGILKGDASMRGR